MYASQFVTEFGVETSIVEIDEPTIPSLHPAWERPWFKATFTYHASDGTRRSIDYELGGGLHDTLNTISPREMLYRMAREASDGEDYEDYIDTYGPDLRVTCEQWERGEAATRARCREWITDETMWDKFLTIQPDDAAAVTRYSLQP